MKLLITSLLLVSFNLCYANSDPINVGLKVIVLSAKIHNIVCDEYNDYTLTPEEKKLIYNTDHISFLSMIEQCGSHITVSDENIWIYKIDGAYANVDLKSYSVIFL